MSEEKLPILWDLDLGHCATFEDLSWNTNRENDFVLIKYYPFNNLPVFGFKSYEYTQPISRKFIYDVAVPAHNGLVGQPKRLFIIFRGDKNGIMHNIIGNSLQDQVKKLTEQINELQKENAKLKQENIDAKTNVSKAVQSAKALTDKTTSNADITGLPGIGGFARPPNTWGGF